MMISGCSCSTPKAESPSDPLAGFHAAYGKVDQPIITDYQNYIQNLSAEEKGYSIPIAQYFEDGAGQHAVEIKIGLNGTVWLHILIYDRDNKRIKTIKHAIGHYAS